MDRLHTYRKKRDFERTPEPDGVERSTPLTAPRFVVQEHHATALHWDFRLEKHGVLVSWAVPKGIPVDPATNHLAIHTEDHPLSYIDFAGSIPEDEYGGGKVVLWDTGTYDEEKFRDNEVIVRLHGSRLDGKYALFQTKGNQWMIHRMDSPQDPAREPIPAKLVPMLPTLAKSPPGGDGWAFEVKWDGVRAIAYIDGGRVRLESRNLLDITRQYPEVSELGEALGAHEVVLDGELVAFGDDGQPRFERLQQRMGLTSAAVVRRRREDVPVTYLVFDLLFLDGHSTMRLAYEQRRRLLTEMVVPGDTWQVPEYHVGDGPALLAATKARGLEGLVAKRLDSSYEPGRRTQTWLKVKNSRNQEFVIGGYTKGEGNRTATLGALLIGYHDGDVLRYAGKVGTGLTEAFMVQLLPRLRALERRSTPFADGKPPARATFVEPELVCQVAFTEWTSGGMIRHPAFKGLRTDKSPREVTRDMPEADK
ncbi:MAG: non-homologous end-joining DNA ligase [Tepidiformaceae bacterium]